MIPGEWRERLGRQVKLRELRVLVAVAEQGSFRKAARELHLTQPAVTAAIGELEHSLGVRLFDRTSRGATLTTHGSSLVKRASAIFGELSLAAEDLESISRGSQQALRIGAGGGGWGTGILSAALGKLFASPLDAMVLIREADEDVLLGLLKARQIDLYFSRLSPMRTDPDLSVQRLFEDSICVLARHDHPLAGRRNVPWTALTGENWVTPQWGSLSFDQVQRTLHKGGLTMPRHVIETASAPTAIGMVLEANFLCFGTFHYHANSALRSMLAILDVDLPNVAVPFGAVTLRHREPDPLAVRITDLVAVLARASAGSPRALTRQG